MFDDLDDLLEDIPQQKKGGAAKQPIVSVKKPMGANKADDD
jgi:hypothetical protein